VSGVRLPPRRRLGRAALALAVVLAVAGGAAGLWFREELARLNAVNTLFREDRIVANFSNMGAAFLHVPVPRGDGPVAPLPPGPPLALPAAVADWVAQTDVTGLAVVSGGRLVHESAYLGTGAGDLRISWSMAKSFVSVLVGTALERGEIADLDVPVTLHAPQMAGTAYDGATLRDLLQMPSGVRFDEDYLDPRSDINRMGRVLALGGTMDGFAAALTARDRPPGQAMVYNSIDTHVVGMVLRGATGRSLPELLSERVVGPLGLEAAPIWLTDGEGVAFALGGLNLTLRDYARFGLMALRGGEIDGRRVVGADWLAESMAPSAATPPGATRYGYHWWVPGDAEARAGEVLARGVYGQFLYLDRARDVVIVATGADRDFRAEGRFGRALAALRALADAAVAQR